MSQGIDLGQVWSLLSGNGRRIITLTLGGAALALATALTWPPTYVSQATILPSKNTAQSTGLGGLFGLLAPRTTSPAQIIALARSKQLASDVINDLDLKPLLFSERWNTRLGAWRPTWLDRFASWRGRPASPQPPSDSAAVDRFQRAVTVTVNKENGLITVRARWRNPEQAARWTGAIVEQLGTKLRSRTQDNGRFVIDSYRASLQPDTSAELADDTLGRVAIKRLIEATAADVARATADPTYGFEVIDPPSVPDRPEQPRPLLITALGGALGLAFGLGLLVLGAGRGDDSISDK